MLIVVRTVDDSVVERLFDVYAESMGDLCIAYCMLLRRRWRPVVERTLDMAPPCAGILLPEATPEGERK